MSVPASLQPARARPSGPSQPSSAPPGHPGPASMPSQSLYHLQPTSLGRNSLDSDSPSIYSQESPDQAQPGSEYQEALADEEEAYSRSPSPGAGSFLTRGGTFSTVRGQGEGATHYVRQLDTPPASPPLPGTGVTKLVDRAQGREPGSTGQELGMGDPAQGHWDDDGLPGYRKPTVRSPAGRAPARAPGVGTMIRRRGGATGGASGSLSDASEEGETEAQRVAREAAEAQLERDEMLQKRRAAEERAAAFEQDRMVDEQAQQAELVKGIENMLADQIASPSGASGSRQAALEPPPPPAASSSQPQPSHSPSQPRFQLHDSPLPPSQEQYTSTPPGWNRAHPAPSSAPVHQPTPRHAYDPHDDLDYLTAPALGPPVPAYEPTESAHSVVREPTPHPPPFVPTDTPAAAEAARHPKEAFFSEARRQDFRQINGLEPLAPGVDGTTPRAEEERPDPRASWEGHVEGHAYGGSLASPPFDGQQGGVHLSQGLQDRGYQPEWRPPPPPQPELVESPEAAYEPSHVRPRDERVYRGSYQPPPRVFTPVEFQQRPVSEQPRYGGAQSPRYEFASGEQDYFGRVEGRGGGGARRDGPPVSASGGMSGYYRPVSGMGSDTIHEHSPYGPGPFSPGGPVRPMPFGPAGLPHPSEFAYATSSARGHPAPYSPTPSSRRASSIPPHSGYGALPPPPLPHPGYASASSFSHYSSDRPLLSPGSPSQPSHMSSFQGHPLSPRSSRLPDTADEHAAWEHREFLRWRAEQAAQQRRMEQEGEGLTHSSGSVGESASVAGAGGVGKASRRESIKGLLKGLGVGGKGKQREREGEFEEVGEKTTILWGWT